MTEIVIENMEEPGEWIVLEYMHSYSIAGEKLVITNVDRKLLELIIVKGGNRHPRVLEESVSSYCKGRNTILLDPDAELPLTQAEAATSDCLVIGGILGDYPRKGRTRLLRERIPWAKPRNLGPKQLSVDGAVYVAQKILSGEKLEDIKLIDNPVIKISSPLGEAEIILPFSYPEVNGKPLLAPSLKDFLARKAPLTEY